jgi:hypothetical protein
MIATGLTRREAAGGMRSGVDVAMWRLVLWAGACLLWLSPASALEATRDSECDSFAVRLAATAPFWDIQCDSSGSHQVIQAVGDHESILVVSHEMARHRTYLVRVKPKDITTWLDSFGAIKEWTDRTESHGFGVGTFRGVLKKQPDSSVSCFTFVRYSGHVPQSTGYRHAIWGFYCDAGPETVPDTHIDELLGSIESDFD